MQVSIVRGGVVRRPEAESFLFGAAKVGIERLGDSSGHLPFHREDISQFAIVALRPEMRVRRRFDQLHIDVHRVAGFLHAAFEQIGYAELLADFAQVIRRAFVFLGGSARDDFQRSDLGKPSSESRPECLRQNKRSPYHRSDFRMEELRWICSEFVVASLASSQHRQVREMSNVEWRVDGNHQPIAIMNSKPSAAD